MPDEKACSVSLEEWGCVRQNMSPYLLCCMDTCVDDVQNRIRLWSVPCVVCHGEPIPATFHDAMHACAQRWTDCLFVWCPFTPRFGIFGCNGAGVDLESDDDRQSSDPLEAATRRIGRLALRCMLCNVITSVADLASVPHTAPLLVVDSRSSKMSERVTQWRREQRHALKFVVDLAESEWFSVEHGVTAGDEVLLTRAG